MEDKKTTEIQELLKKADKELRPLPYRIGLGIARKYLSR